MNVIFKEKEEVQEFLKNLGIEYRFSCYSEKDPQGCQLLAEYLAGIEKNYRKSTQLLKENCDTKDFGRSCANYGQNLLYEKGCVRDLDQALDYLSKGCELDDATGCDYAGKLYCGLEKKFSKRIKLDTERGLRYLERGCNLESKAQMYESSESCYAAAFAYMGKVANVKPDLKKAIEFGTKACEMNHISGCHLTATAYEALGDAENRAKFLEKYHRLKKQIDDNVQVEMQRT